VLIRPQGVTQLATLVPKYHSLSLRRNEKPTLLKPLATTNDTNNKIKIKIKNKGENSKQYFV
jgi:hypothetical protein